MVEKANVKIEQRCDRGWRRQKLAGSRGFSGKAVRIHIYPFMIFRAHKEYTTPRLRKLCCTFTIDS